MVLWKRTRATLLAALLLWLIAPASPHATFFTVFGPRTLTRTTGAPNVFTFTFNVGDPSLPYTLRIDNHGVDSAIVTLNGVQIIGPSECRSRSRDDWKKPHDWDDDDWDDRHGGHDDWRKKHDWKSVIEKSVRLRASNTLQVELRSKPGTHIRIQIFGKDQVPPKITATATPPKNQAGWNRTDVQVSFACSDSGSGIASCSPAKVVTTEGKGQIVTGKAVDKVGNTATAKVTLDIDKTPPAIAARAQPAPNDEGWINRAATVTFACTDDRSGVASCTQPITVPADGGNQIVRGTAVDKAGNVAETTLPVNVDKTQPTITATLDPPPNLNGWNHTDVTVRFACADAVSGIAVCPAPITITGNGSNQPVSGTARDRAGNTASASVTVSLDKTPPSIVASASPAPNAHDWNNTDVVVSFACSDDGAGVAACPAAVTTSSEGGSQNVSRTIEDRAGNSATASVTLNIDKTPPSVTAATLPPPNDAGWNNTDVTVTFTCHDGAAGVESCPSAVPVASEGANQVVGGTATDLAGNRATAQIAVNLDKTLPIVSIASPQAGVTLRTSPTSLSGNVSDSLSGIALATCNGTTVTPGAGGLVSCGPSLADGSNTLSIAATDAAGNVATAPVDVTYQPNRPPTGSPGGPYTSLAGEPVSFTATGTDPDNDPLTFTWDFGSGPVEGQTATHTYTTAGTYQANLTIADDHGGTTTGVAQVTILPVSQPNRPPVAHAGGPYLADVGQDFAFNGSGSTDPDGDPLTYGWSFGDGATGTGASPTHIFVAAGTYTVTLTVEDGRGGANSTSTQAVVNAVGTPAGDRGILDGEVYDDSKGLPLAEADVMLLAAGGDPLPNPIVVVADDRGQFTLSVKSGDAILRITKTGFTTVERVVSVPPDKAATALDARLTPLDARTNQVQPALNDVARNAAGAVTLALQPGSVATTVSMRVTSLSPQGLAGRLPFGWSPAAAVDIAPPGIVFQQTAQLSVPNTANLPAGSEVAVALYDSHQHRWTAIAPGLVSADGRTIACGVDSSGQLAFVIADDPPFTPHAAVAGQPLAGVAAVGAGSADTATGIVVPRAAPPGDNARATGTIDLRPAAPRPSGTVLQAFVTERYNLLDSSRVVPPSFTQDIVLYAKPIPAGRASLQNCQCLTASFPITPSIAFSIQQLERGVVALDVTAPEPETGGSIVGPSGGTATDAHGDFVQVPAGALTTDTIVEIAAVAPERTAVTLPAGFGRLGVVELNLGGQTLNQSAAMSIPRPPGLADNAQVIVAEVISDPRGVRRLRIAGVGHIASGRVAVQTTLNALTFPGVTRGGQYLFLVAPTPLGFIAGNVVATGGTPQSLALVSADNAPFADVTGAAGAYIVAGAVNVPSLITAVAPASTIAATTTLTAINQIARLDLTLDAVSLSVVSTSPPANASKVPLNSPIVVRFSEPLDATTATTSSITLRLSGSAVPGTVTLSPDRRIATLLPAAELQSNSIYTLALSDALRGDSGTRLAPFTPITFTTVDASKPLVTPGQITANVPDDDGLVLIFGTSGTSEPMSGVTAANLRTQETVTAMASTDGSFRLRLPAAIGDEISVTLRDARSREVTVSIAQFEGPDGTAGIGRAGGRIAGPDGRTGTVRPRALTGPATFKISSLADSTSFPSLPADFAYADRFTLSFQGGPFNQLRSLTLAESQNRFPPAVTTSAPFEATGSLVVPADFLVNGTVRFSATAEDTGGNRNTASGSTLVVTANPATASIETTYETAFPAVFLAVSREAVPAQQVGVAAVAPNARVDFDLPSPAGLDPNAPVLLARATLVGSERKLAIVDQFAPVDAGGVRRLNTAGRQLPGAAATGNYTVVVSSVPLVFVSGQIAGPGRTVAVEGSPFVIEPSGPNARFLIPVAANRPFVLNFIDPATGQIAATASGQAPATGVLRLSQTIGATAAALSVTAVPDARSLVDINEPVVFTFSEPIDPRTLAGNILVTDAAGIETFGRFSLSPDGLRVTFVPNRRWRFGASYRYTVSPRLIAMSGGRLPQNFSGSFTTYAPKVLGALSTGATNDVAVSGTTVMAGGASGLTLVDAARPELPVQLAQIAAGAPVGAVALLPAAQVINRNGAPVNGLLGVAATGTDGTAGQLQIYDLNTPASPALIGNAQLTVPAGQAAPPNVPASPGTPGAIALTSDGRALVAVLSIGVESVNLGSAIPVDAANPGGALGTRFPASGFESASHTVVVGDKALVAGMPGLTILDLATLDRLGAISTGGNARGVAGLEAFRMDLNGDGTIDSTTEIFDLAVVANGQDGTLQFFNTQDASSPRLISVVRLAGEAGSVVLDATENLAYVGNGTRGVALVDLAGPVGIQPIDLDRNGIDDRVLGTVLTRASAGRLALDLARGIAVVADGPAGLTVVQIVPPRTRFTQILRDPAESVTGDEESMVDSHRAFVTDSRIQVQVSAVTPPQSRVFLAIQETPDANGPRVLTLDDESTSVPLTAGLNTVFVRIDRLGGSSGASAAFVVQDEEGRALDRFDFRLLVPDAGDALLQAVFIGPQPAVIPGNRQDVQLNVAAVYSNGRVLNVTSSASGTTYDVSDPRVATVSADGLVTAVAGGVCSVTARHGGIATTTFVTVQHLAVLTSVRARRSLLALTGAGAQTQLRIDGRLSDGFMDDATLGMGTTYQSSDSTIVAVDAEGRLTAVGEGLATITITNGAFSDQVRVEVTFRTPANLTALTVEPQPSGLTTDTGSLLARAVVAGTGSLDGHVVTFSLSGPATIETTGVTDDAGVALAILDGPFTAAAGILTASVVNPADSAVRSATQAVTIAKGTGDHEPNDDLANASRFEIGRTVSGTLAAVGDARDLFRVLVDTDGALSVAVVLPDTIAAGDVRASVLSSTGTLVQEVSLGPGEGNLSGDVAAGVAFVRIEAVNGGVAYSVRASFEPAAVVITGVTPAAAAPGTAITISGSGFSTNPGRNVVLVASMAARVTTSSSTEIQAVVPAGAVNGRLQVMVGRQLGNGPAVDVGVQGPLPAITLTAANPNDLRVDPTSGMVMDMKRLVIRFDPLATRAQVDAVAFSHGGVVAGYLPTFNTYVFEFAGVTSLPALHVIGRALENDPLVAAVTISTYGTPSQSSFKIDTFDVSNIGLLNFGSSVPSTTAAAYNRISLFAAIRRIRSTPPFDVAANLWPVRAAVLDSGFNGAPGEFSDASGNLFVQQINAFSGSPGAGGRLPTEPFSDFNGHGTMVASVIGAVNNGVDMSGVVNSLFDPNNPAERPQPMLVYRVATGFLGLDYYSNTAAWAALEDIHRRNTQGAPQDGVDVANLSFGAVSHTFHPMFLSGVAEYSLRFSLLAPRTLVTVSAGNDGIDARYSYPPAAAAGHPHVMVVGATGTANTDGSGEDATGRAIFRGSSRGVPLFFPSSGLCDNGIEGGSSCGALVTIAAPGEDVMVAMPGGGVDYPRGTSFSAPMVAGVAALLQAIRPRSSTGPLAPALIAQALVGTGDRLSGTWSPGTMRRVNADAAVASFLPAADQQLALIADQEAENGPGAGKGKIIGLNVDPMTGTKVGSDIELLLDFNRSGIANFLATQPTSLVYSPVLDEAYAVVSAFDASSADGVSPNVGDGVLFLGRRSRGASVQLQAFDFIPFCGAPFWVGCGGPHPPAVRLATIRPGMVVSKDGRLLYVATNTRITIINLVSRRIVRFLSDLPSPYNLLAAQQRSDAMGIRLDSLRLLAETGYVDEARRLRRGTHLSSLTLSPDGRTLYAALETGAGGDRQPGAVIPIDVDLYRDAQTRQSGLQPDLSTYFTVRNPRFLHMRDPGGALGGDEPRALAVSADGKHLYVVNGGVNLFRGLAPEEVSFKAYAALWGASTAAVSLGGLTGGMAGLMLSASAQITVQAALLASLAAEVQRQMQGGMTLLSATGTVGVFTTAPQPANATPAVTQQFVFPSDLPWGWNVSAASGNLIVNQFRARHVYSARPFGLAIRPDGKRGLMPFYQTGNFGVLDLDGQKKFLQNPPTTPNPNTLLFGPPVPDTMFHGLVAVTPALLFDNHLWPVRGRMKLFHPADPSRLFELPSPDEPLLFPWDIQYAQNGRFAVATHSGVGRSPGRLSQPQVLADCSMATGDYCGTLPDPFEAFDPFTTQWLRDLGFVPNVNVRPGQSIAVPSGGGAVSFIDDKAITDDFAAHLSTNQRSRGVDPGMGGILRAYYSVIPVCKTVQTDQSTGQPIPYCEQPVTTTLLSFNTPQAPQRRFHRPRGVTIQPFVTIEAPRFGDVVDHTTAVETSWRDSRVFAFQLRVLDLDVLDPNGDPTIVGGDAGALLGPDRTARRKTWTFGPLLAGTTPVDGHRYRLELEVLEAASGDRLSRTTTDVVFSRAPVATPCASASATLLPRTLTLEFRPTSVPARLRQFDYRIPMAAGDTLTAGPDLRVVRASGQPPLAVSITTTAAPRRVGNEYVGSYVLELQNHLLTPDATDVFAKDNFEVELTYRTTNCDPTVRRVTANVEVTPNNIAAQADVLRVPPTRGGFDVCSFTDSKADDFRDALKPLLHEDLHIDPIECDAVSPHPPNTPLADEYRERHCGTGGPFPPNLILNVDLGGGDRVLVRPIYSVTNLVLTSEVPKEVPGDGVGNDNGVCEVGETCYRLEDVNDAIGDNDRLCEAGEVCLGTEHAGGDGDGKCEVGEICSNEQFAKHKVAETYERGTRPSVTPGFDRRTGVITNEAALAAQGFWINFQKYIQSDRTSTATAACPSVIGAQSIADFLSGTTVLVQCLPDQPNCPTNRFMRQR